MNCPICGGKIEKKNTNIPIELEEGLLYVKEVPAEVCNQCGETFIADGIAEKLEQMVENAKKQKIEIEVISFQSAA